MLKPEVRQATVLVADDLEAYRCLLNDLLQVQGYQVVCAADGGEAMKILELVSKIPPQDFHASESNHAQEIIDVVLVARDQSAKHLQPSEETLYRPAPPIAA